MSKKTFQQKELCEIAEISSGNSAPQGLEHFSHIGHGMPFVRMQDLGRYGKTPNLTEVADYIQEATSKKLKVFPAGSLLIPKSGASIRLNHRAILGVDAHVVSHLAIIQAKSSHVLNKYLYYWLHTIDFSNKAHDSDLPSLKLSDIANLEVPLPSLKNQQEIVSTLEEIDDLRQKQRKAIELTRQMIPALFYEMFGDPIKNNMNWNLIPLQKAITSIAYGCSKKASEEPQGLPMIRMNNVTCEGDLDLRVLKYINLNEAELKKFSLKKGDILFNRTNSRELVGKTSIWDQDIPAVFASYFIRVQLDQAVLLPFYLSIYMNLPFMKQYLKELARGAIGQANINAKELSNIQVMIPPIEFQKLFTQKAQECLALLEHQEQSLQKLDVLFETTTNQFFSHNL